MSIEEISDNLYIYRFEGCTGDEAVNIENAVTASDIEVLSLVIQKREGNLVPPGICRVFDIAIRADDPSSIKIVLPMMSNENMLGQQDESQIIHKSPRAQMAQGTQAHFVECAEGLVLMSKNSDDSAACVKSSSVSKLVARGWGTEF